MYYYKQKEVRCVNTGVVYPSIKKAAEAINSKNFSAKEISRRCHMKNNPLKTFYNFEFTGRTFTYLDNLKGQKPSVDCYWTQIPNTVLLYSQGNHYNIYQQLVYKGRQNYKLVLVDGELCYQSNLHIVLRYPEKTIMAERMTLGIDSLLFKKFVKLVGVKECQN